MGKFQPVLYDPVGGIRYSEQKYRRIVRSRIHAFDDGEFRFLYFRDIDDLHVPEWKELHQACNGGDPLGTYTEGNATMNITRRAMLGATAACCRLATPRPRPGHANHQAGGAERHVRPVS